MTRGVCVHDAAVAEESKADDANLAVRITEERTQTHERTGGLRS